MSIKSAACGMLLGLLFLSGCTNPFATRTPDPPSSGDNLVTSQSDPQQLLDKVQSAFEVQLATTYAQCFDSVFVFQGAGSEASELVNWNRMLETAYFESLVQDEQLTSARLSFPETGEPAFIPLSQNEEEVRFRYEVLLITRTAPGMERYRGRCVLKVVKAGQENWFIREWQDLAEESDSTWSTLRAKYR